MDTFDTMSMPYMSSHFHDVSNSEYLEPMPSFTFPAPGPIYPQSDVIAYVQQYPHDQWHEQGTNAHNSPEDLSFISPNFHNGSTTSYSPPMDDCYSDTPGHMDGRGRATSSPEAPSIEHGNRLLSFQFPTYQYTVLDAQRCPTSMSLTAQLHGMFFLAESSRTGGSDGMHPPVELTCYRRNLFQITGCITLPQMMRYVLTEHGDPVQIVSQELCISATESVEGNPIKIISVPWKTPVNGQTSAPEDKTEKEPSSIPLAKTEDFSGEDFTKFPIEWKRLQFRVATANNGRRKELQQHFIIKLAVVATLSNGEKVTVCEALSGPVIVRGRSPRNFSQRRDFPLSGSGGSLRKAMQSSSRHRTTSPDQRDSRSRATSAVPQAFSRHHSPSLSQPQTFVNWGDLNNSSSGNMQMPSLTSASSISSGPLDYSKASPETIQARHNLLKRKAATPDPNGIGDFNIFGSNAHLSMPAERPMKNARSVTNSPQSQHQDLFMPFATSAADFSTSQAYDNLMGNAGVNSQDLNKFLPSNLDDWMPPSGLPDVDPIFKHSGFPNYMHSPAMMAVGGSMNRGRSHKRYASDSFL
ncbi:hypothetical protein MMC25_004443 [Agyrium rufum]|nr:hypothetical protein [Agyrium rufum]